MTYFLIFLAVCFGLYILTKVIANALTVFEYETGLKYSKGKFKKTLPPGLYWRLPLVTTITKVDNRPQFLNITGQEVLSADAVTLKISLAANYQVIDPVIAINQVLSYEQAMYTELQLALRQIVGEVPIDTLLAQRKDISEKLSQLTTDKIAALGLQLNNVDIKDVMFPGAIKEMFTKVVSAQKEGLAALEKARGEQAALRCLANAAKMMENNPTLMQLRTLQSVEQSKGNSIVMSIPATPILTPASNQTDESAS